MRVYLTSPQKVGGVWIVPVCSWYHFSWDREPSLDQLVNLPLDQTTPIDSHSCFSIWSFSSEFA